jgi:DNA-binding transcriptional MerR regulator
VEDQEGSLTVGDLAAAGAVSVRTLQHYDRLGLLPAGRDAAGRRRYGPDDVGRLQQIRLLAEIGIPLAAIGDLLAAEAGQNALSTYRRQLDRVELAELRLRAKRAVLTSVVWALERCPGLALPEAVLAALMNLDQTLLAYANLDLATEAAEVLAADPAALVEIYFRWKAVAVEALLLIEAGVPPESPVGGDVGAHWQAYLAFALGPDEPETREQAFSASAQQVEQWPPADQHLYRLTKDFLDRCHHMYLTRPRA